MSLDKGIKYGKERRRQHRRAKAVDPSCRNHGSCDRCRLGRTHNGRRAAEAADAALKEE